MGRIVVFIICLLAAAGVYGQSRPPGAMGPMGDAGAANLPGQRIGPNDLIAVSVYDAPEFTRTLRVSADGFVRLPMVQSRLKAAGLVPAELETQIAETLVKEGIFVKPVVMVTVVEYFSRPIAVVGAVKKPLTFQAVGRVTLLDALARAEGLSADAGPEILLSKDQPGEGSQRLVQRIAVRELIDAARPELNVLLTGGEEIRVPEAKKIYVTGNVKKPGAFPVKENDQLTVLRALALAEGLSPFPQKQAYIYRFDEKRGGKVEIEVPLRMIIQRKAVDLALEPEDTLYIPEDGGKKMAAGLVDKTVGFATATVSGVLIWRGR